MLYHNLTPRSNLSNLHNSSQVSYMSKYSSNLSSNSPSYNKCSRHSNSSCTPP